MLRRGTDELERAVHSFMPPQPGSFPTFFGNTLRTNRNEATLSLERYERNWQQQTMPAEDRDAGRPPAATGPWDIPTAGKKLASAAHLLHSESSAYTPRKTMEILPMFTSLSSRDCVPAKENWKFPGIVLTTDFFT